jgi:exopolyphosphatase/guanosine-5'-triphosphate,3'-diphosphate pyrophosphatase
VSIHAVIDVGTNSIKMHVAEVTETRVRVLADMIDVTRLGQGLHETGTLSEEAMGRNIGALSRLVARAKGLGARDVVGVGTMALRTAANADVFRRNVFAACGLDIEVISGEEEARISYLAGQSGLAVAENGRICIFDTGGGSTEFIYGRGATIENRFSLNVGCRAPTEQFLRSDPVTEDELRQLLEHVSESLGTLDSEVDAVIGIGGTVTTMEAVHQGMDTYEPDRIHGSSLDLDEVNRQVDLYQGRTLEERTHITGLVPKRADVILTGAAIVKTVMEKLEVASITVSDRGLRHGIMVDRFGVR